MGLCKEFDILIILVLVCCPPHLPLTQTHPLPFLAPVWAQAGWPLWANWVQPMGGTDCREGLERGGRWAGGEKSQGISFPIASLLQTEALAGPASPQDRSSGETVSPPGLGRQHSNPFAPSALGVVVFSAFSCSWCFTNLYWVPLLCLLSHKWFLH